MNIEVEKFGFSANLAWHEPRGSGPLVVFCDSREMWAARRKMIKEVELTCCHLHLDVAGPHNPADLDAAFVKIDNWNADRTLFVACNEAVVPCLSTMPVRSSDKVLLVNPLQSGEMEFYERVIEQRWQVFSGAKEVVVLYDPENNFSNNFCIEFCNILPSVRLTQVRNLGSFTLGLVRQPSYLKAIF